MKRSTPAAVAALMVGVVAAFAIVLGGQWYYYVAYASSPYDEVGIAINSRMPAPLRSWGCARIAERFPRTLPPFGCQRS